MILLVRHAACENLGERLNGRGGGAGLTAEGRRDAERLAARLADEVWTQVRTSPQRRCRQTAEAIADRERADILVCDDLDEVDFGDWTGRSFEELDADPAWRFWNDRRSLAQAPGGERMRDVQRRMARALDDAAAAGGAVVLVTHAEPIRAALAHLLGFSLDHWAQLDIAPASVTRIRTAGQDFAVAGVNESLGT